MFRLGCYECGRGITGSFQARFETMPFGCFGVFRGARRPADPAAGNASTRRVCPWNCVSFVAMNGQKNDRGRLFRIFRLHYPCCHAAATRPRFPLSKGPKARRREIYFRHRATKCVFFCLFDSSSSPLDFGVSLLCFRNVNGARPESSTRHGRVRGEASISPHLNVLSLFFVVGIC